MYFSIIKVKLSKLFFICPVVFYPVWIFNNFIKHHQGTAFVALLITYLVGAFMLLPQILRPLVLMDMRDNGEAKIDKSMVFLFSVLSLLLSLFWPPVLFKCI